MDFSVKSIQQIGMKSKAAVQLQILQSMEVKVVEHHLKNIPFVQNNRVHNILRAGFCPACGGVNVISHAHLNQGNLPMFTNTWTSLL